MTGVTVPLRRGDTVVRDALRRGGDLVRSTPITSGLLGVLLLTTVALRNAGTQDQQVLKWASTNLQNLSTAPIRSFVASALVLPSEVWLPTAIALGAGLGLLERRIGSLLAVGVFASAHVLVTLATETGVWAGINAGDLPDSARTQIDAGVSYGMYGSLAAAVLLMPRRLQLPALVTVLTSVVAPALTDLDMTAVGHVMSVVVGLAWWPLVRRRAEARRSDPIVRSG